MAGRLAPASGHWSCATIISYIPKKIYMKIICTNTRSCDITFAYYFCLSFTYLWWTPIAIPNLKNLFSLLAAAVNSVCTIGICYIVNKIILPAKFNLKVKMCLRARELYPRVSLIHPEILYIKWMTSWGIDPMHRGLMSAWDEWVTVGAK
jgi:hypothetical protein